MSRRIRAAAALLCVALLSGCGFKGIYSLPLPGAAANGGHTYTVKVELADVLDLVPYSAVKVNGATVGHIASIALDHGHAVVTCKLRDSAHLPADAVASVQQTSVLGEKFVEIEPPTDVPATGTLADGATIALDRTSTDASIEEVLGALSALLNGGGVAQVKTIADEVNTALHGRTGVSRDLLSQFTTFATGLDRQKHQIVQALRGVDRLSRTVKGQENQLTDALVRVPPALQILADDRRQLTGMLTSVARLGDVAVRVIHGSQRALVANLRNLAPTLDKLARVGEIIPKTLGIIITYPTADSVEKEYFGDYGNLSLTVDLSGQSLATYLQGVQLATATGPLSARSARAKAMAPVTHWSAGRTIDGLLRGGAG